MKKILLFIACFLSCSAIIASPIDRAQAKAAAKAFMDSKGWVMSSNEARPLKSMSNTTAAEPVVYAFNAESGKGFVLVSADDCTEQILGYCDNASFDEANMPSGLKAWLVGVGEQLDYARAHGMQSPKTVANKPAIQPLVTSKWGQDAPYNELTPEINGQHTPTGCLATAVAQIMYYHKWPESQVSAIGGYTTETTRIHLDALPATTFKWDQMRDTYRSSDTDGAAVSELMRYVGQYVWMNYALAGSGASEYYIPNMLQQYGYYPSLHRVERSGYTISQWDELIYTELKNNRPVLYCGYTANWEGHAFVCDGYDGNGLYHINWGWDGYCDGYFRLSILNPNNTTSSGSASTEDGFATGQRVVVGIQKEGPDNTYPKPWPLYDIGVTNNTISYTVIAIASGTHYLGLADVDDDGNIKEVYGSSSKYLSSGRNVSTNYDCTKLPVGQYRLVPCIRKNSDTDWTIIGGNTYYFDVTVGENNNISYVMHPITNLEVTDIKFPKGATTMTESRIDFTLENLEDEYEGKVYIFGASGDTPPSASIGAMDVAIMHGETQNLVGYAKVPTLDDLHIWIATDELCQNIIGERQFLTYHLELADKSVAYDPLVVTVNFKNNTAIDYSDKIRATVYNAKTKKSMGNLDTELSIPAGETAQLVYNTLKLTNSSTYYITFQCVGSQLSGSLSNISGRVDIDFKTDGIEEVNSDKTLTGEGVSYNLQGQRVKHNANGIIIRNGKKMVNK